MTPWYLSPLWPVYHPRYGTPRGSTPVYIYRPSANPPPGKITQPQIWQVNSINLFFSYQSEIFRFSLKDGNCFLLTL